MNEPDRTLAARLGRQTVDILRAGSYTSPSGRTVTLADTLRQTVENTVEYDPGRHPTSTPRRAAQTRLRVENDTVLSVCRQMVRDGPVAALNFASATSPGGGFLSGARAQEESIARSSGLYAALEGRDMYVVHRNRRDAMYSDFVIYSRDVPVFRVDAGDLLDEPWMLSVVTCPAVNGAALAKYEPHRLNHVPAVMVARTDKMLAVAEAHGVRRFILGAWGCGAFGLDAEMMARIFDEALQTSFRHVFDEIVFAITDWSREQRFIGPFLRRFGPARTI